jgi:hypothetical protein
VKQIEMLINSAESLEEREAVCISYLEEDANNQHVLQRYSMTLKAAGRFLLIVSVHYLMLFIFFS